MGPRRGSRSAVRPRWAFRLLWTLHRAGFAISGGRLGLRAARDDRLGVLRLHTLGRRSGQERASMLFYLTEGQAFAVVASNAGAAETPAWWLNLQAQPRATVEVPSGSASVQAREATPGERERLWTRFVAQLADYQTYAAATDRDIPVVMLEPVREEAHA